MKRKLLTTLFSVLLLSSLSFAQWTFTGAWPDTNFKGGTHGIAVSPDGKVWTAAFNRTPWVTPTGTIQVSPILVFNADGSLVDTIYFAGSDTLTGQCRGMGVDADGNILYTQSSPGKIVKINYQTLEGMGSHLLTEIGSSPTAPSVTSDGTIYIGPVVGGGTSAIATYDKDLIYLGNAVDGPAAIARTMEVSPDGLSIYWTTFTSNPLQVMVYTRPDDLSSFALTDSVLQGMAIESSAWNPATGLLWVSNSKIGTGPYSAMAWYGYDVTSKTVVDSIILLNLVPIFADDLPRGIDFSPDGNIAYVSNFGPAYSRIYKFEKVTGVNDEGQVVVNGYKLSQNYPNPFNPSTKINFEIPQSGLATLKVYDMLGKEVAVLVQEELASGTHSVNFNAANLASGTYLYQLNVNGTRITNKMILLK